MLIVLTIDSQLKTYPPFNKMVLISSQRNINGTVTPKIEIVLNIRIIIFLHTIIVAMAFSKLN